MVHALAARCRFRGGAKPISGPARRGAYAAGALLLAFTMAVPTAAQARPVPGSFADMVDKVAPAVVNISAERTQTAQMGDPTGRRTMPFPEGSPFHDFFRRYFGEDGNRFGNPDERGQNRGRRMPQRKQQALGSGFIIDPDGYVVTNNHVINKASRVEVILHDGERFDAKVIGTDSRTDLALLKVKADRKLPYVEWGNSEKARVGDWVLAVGNPYGLGGTVTAGIISARGRDIAARTLVDFLQIDAPINRGNSGGPTFDMDGKVVGVNTAIYSPTGGSIGIGFAIPAKLAKQVVDELRSNGKVSRGWLGVQIQPVTEDMAKALDLEGEKGAMVAAVVPGSPAEKAGLKSGDVILSWDGKEVDSTRDLVRKVTQVAAGKSIEVVLLRDGDRKTLEVTVGTRSEEDQQASRRQQTPDETQEPASVAKLGARVADLTPAMRSRFEIEEDVGKGAVVVAVEPGSPAADKGLRAGDVITKVGNTEVSNAAEVGKAIEAAVEAKRAALLIRIVRDGNARYLGLKLS